jgi:hypothetical protein
VEDPYAAGKQLPLVLAKEIFIAGETKTLVVPEKDPQALAANKV